MLKYMYNIIYDRIILLTGFWSEGQKERRTLIRPIRRQKDNNKMDQRDRMG
jgi:hypothetical protein